MEATEQEVIEAGTEPTKSSRLSGAKRRKSWMDDTRVLKDGIFRLVVPEQGPRVGRGRPR